jgi:hypothetical protein
MRAALAMLMLVPGLHAWAADPLDEELARYNDAGTRLEKSFQDSLAHERAHSIAALTVIARHEATLGENASETWKQVVLLDSANEEARKFFTAAGKLDEVLAEVQEHHGLLLGKGEVTQPKAPPDPRLDMTGAKLVRIQAQIGQGYAIGNHRAGTTVVIQYVSGTWATSATGTLESPDAAASSSDDRVELLEDSGNSPTSLAVLPAGTAEMPFLYTLERDVVGLTLRIHFQKGTRRTVYQGEVQYRVKIIQR